MTVPDVLPIGRVEVDLDPEQRGEPRREATTFRGSIDGTSTGGTSTDVTVAGRMMCADDMRTPHHIDALLDLQRAGGIVT